jgi:hypothetical protein
MPKKTRKQKIRATLKKQVLPSLALPSVGLSEQTSRPLTLAEQTSKSYFLRDFKKSLMVIAIIFTLEIILYFASMSNYVSKFIGIN